MWNRSSIALRAEHPDRFLLGWTAYESQPVYARRDNFDGNTLVTGSPNSRKTATLMRLGFDLLLREPERPLFVIDLKGDLDLVRFFAWAAEKAKRDFRFFNIEEGTPTFAFNPVEQLLGAELARRDVGKTLIEALGIQDTKSGGGYFKDVQQTLLGQVLYGDDYASLEELAKATAELHKREKTRDVEHLLAVLERSRWLPHLNVAGARADQVIDIPTTLDRASVVVFSLSAKFENAATVARLLVAALERYTQLRKRQDPSHRTYAIVDEFQHLTQLASFEAILREARGSGFSTILATQTLAGLHGDWPAVVEQTTSLRLWMNLLNADDAERVRQSAREKHRIHYSGETARTTTYDDKRGEVESRTEIVHNEMASELERNHIARVNEETDLCLYQFAGQPGPRTPRGPAAMIWPYVVPEALWRDIVARPLPLAPFTVTDWEPEPVTSRESSTGTDDQAEAPGREEPEQETRREESRGERLKRRGILPAPGVPADEPDPLDADSEGARILEAIKLATEEHFAPLFD